MTGRKDRCRSVVAEAELLKSHSERLSHQINLQQGNSIGCVTFTTMRSRIYDKSLERIYGKRILDVKMPAIVMQ